MADKKTELSIVIRTVDAATAKIKAINDRLDALTKPVRDFKKQLGKLSEKSGLDDVIGGFKGVGAAIGDLLSKVALIGGVVGLAVAGLFKLVNEFDDLGDKAERFGVSVDFLAQMRYAAEKAGAPVEALDASMQQFSVNLGLARANSGRLVKFLAGPNGVSPALLQQLKAAKSNEEAFTLMAMALAKVADPAKRAALAVRAGFDPAIAPLLAKGAKGVKELRDRFTDLAGGSLQDAADKAGAVDDSMHDLHAATMGLKAALLEGLAPALKVIVDDLREWLRGHRGDIKAFAESLGKRIPEAVAALVDAFKGVVAFIRPFVDSSTKLKIIAIGLAAVMAGPLVSAIFSLGTAILTTPVGWFVGALALIAGGVYEIVKHWDFIAGFFVGVWDGITGAFRDGWNWIYDNVLRFTPFGLIAENWGPIKDFFVQLWDGITLVFRAAWETIKDIVDKVVDAVHFVIDSVEKLVSSSSLVDQMRGSAGGGRSVGDVLAQSRATIDSARAGATQAKITVDFTNAPRGTRVKEDLRNTADVDLSVGYMLGALP